MQFIGTGDRILTENFNVGYLYTITFKTGIYINSACIGIGDTFVMFQKAEPDLLFTLNVDTADEVDTIELYDSGGGTNDYDDLVNRPQINSHTLTGNMSGSDLGLQDTISDLDTIRAGAAAGATAVQPADMTTALALKQDALDAAQLNAVNSGITSTDVAQIETNKNNISNVQTSLAVGSSDDGKVLTASYSGGTGSYAWVAPSGGDVTGVKGSEETNYRTGNISLSAANVGAIPTTEKGANGGVAALDSNGKIAADKIAAGTLANGMTATTQSLSDDSTKVATTEFVHDVVDALPSPMVYKGTLGTGGTKTTLPVDGTAEVGDTYKVITAGTYASQAAKVGDMFICLTKATSSNTWSYVPSGDEPSGTVTNVAVANGGGLTVSGSPITSSGTITVGHSNSVTAKTSSSVKKFTYDAYGHVTGSSELSTAESNALASGIDSTKVAQITTNKNNIATAYGGIVAKNILNYDLSTIKYLNTSGTWADNVYTVRGVICTVNSDNTITITGDNTGGSIIYFVICDLPTDTYTTDYLRQCIMSSDSISQARMTITNLQNIEIADTVNGTLLAGFTTSGSVSRVRVAINNAFNTSVTIKPMICGTDKFAISSAYQPYTLSNTELTTKERANENNISSKATRYILDEGNANTNTKTFDVSNMPNGMYMITHTRFTGATTKIGVSVYMFYLLNGEIDNFTEIKAVTGSTISSITATNNTATITYSENGYHEATALYLYKNQ